MARLQSIKIGHVVGLGFGLILMLALVTGALGRIAYEVVNYEQEIIGRRSEVDRLSLELEIAAIRRTSSLRRYLDQADENILAGNQAYQQNFDASYQSLARLIDNPEENEALQAVRLAEAAFSRNEQEILQLFEEDGFQAAARFLWDREGVVAQDNLLATIDDLRQVQQGTSAAVISRASRIEFWVIAAITVFVPVLLVGGVVMGTVITQRITRPITALVKTVDRLGSDLSARVSPAGPQEIAFLGDSINRMAENLFESQRSLQAYQERLRQELKLASQIQASFLPRFLPQSPKLELAVFWQSAREVAGDFYAYLELDGGHHGLAVGDVSGKGAAAALAATLAEGLLEVYAPVHLKPELLLTALNHNLVTRLAPNHMNVACCYAIIDQEAKQLTVANAGCIPPYLRRNEHVQELEVGGLPLGAIKEYVYPSLSIELEPGDLLIFSSDGFVEAMNGNNEMFGFDRFQTELLKLPANVSAHEAIARLVQVIMEFTNQDDLHDDMTILTARVVG
ncbi:MAG TPA: SpoIIE family protein phosphatase [Anaerolineae bacterium]|nr:SpoIIE family protein phosphatase [Anaerolineae bacterium]